MTRAERYTTQMREHAGWGIFKDDTTYQWFAAVSQGGNLELNQENRSAMNAKAVPGFIAWLQKNVRGTSFIKSQGEDTNAND